MRISKLLIKKMIRSALLETVLYIPTDPNLSIENIAESFESFQGRRMVFFDLETIGSTFGDYQDRVPRQISEVYAIAFDLDLNVSLQEVAQGYLANKDEFHYLVDYTPDVLSRRQKEKSLTFDQAVAQGSEQYVTDSQGRKKWSQPWNVQDYINYTHREDPDTIAKIQKLGLNVGKGDEKTILENFTRFLEAQNQKAGGKIILAGHNILNFDINFLYKRADAYGISTELLTSDKIDIFDTVLMARDFHQDYAESKMEYGSKTYDDFKLWYKKNGNRKLKSGLQHLAQTYKIDTGVPHVAKYDVLTNVNVFIAIYKDIIRYFDWLSSHRDYDDTPLL
tara:strand:- start:48 stop:1055 length:1008 start_codon:yes stop_codon:yes gene_type:complete